MTQLLPKVEFAVQSLYKEQKYCPHCGSTAISNVAKKYARVSVKRCDNCKLSFTSPIYRSALVSEFYDFLYGAEGSTTEVPEANKLAELKKLNFANTDKYFADRIARMKSISPGKRLLEIGSSWGYFLYQARSQGFDVTGVELSDSRRKVGIEELELNIVKDFSALSSDRFDLVYTAHTLEHFIDLSSIFNEINSVLVNNGFLVIEVPNFDYDLFGESVLSIVGAIHPLGFSSQFFKDNLPKYGFDIIGFFDNWHNFPDHATDRCREDVVLLLAKKRAN